MPGLGDSVATLVAHTEEDIKTGLFWYFSLCLREKTIKRLEDEAQDKWYPAWAARAQELLKRIQEHIEEVETLQCGDSAMLVHFVPKCAQKGDRVTIIKEIDEYSWCVRLQGDATPLFTVSKVLLGKVPTS